ncbi:kinase-like domain-containing protein [Lactarius hengduanensis]|nr:kinase-like domain-containing protein [Lactarius hengduanensis]
MPSYPASASQFLGQSIDNGALRIETILGAGAFGVVYRAIDIQTGAQYAVKRVEKEGNEYYQTRERQLHSRVSSHPHVLTFHREIYEGRYAFYVYDLCAGDLYSVMKKVVFFREDELIKRVFIQIIDALEYCHKRGVYHRDLKPENILVSALGGDMDVFVADFGLATPSKMTASACGTSCFMSPESLVAHHHPYSSAQGDVWALGCILAEMIGNVRPWSLATPEDSDYSHYLMERTVLFEKLPVSHTAYLLLRKIFSTKPELRPSLAAIRTEVLAMDTFFLTDSEAGNCGWGDRIEIREAEVAQVARTWSRRAAISSVFGHVVVWAVPLRNLQFGIVVGITVLVWLVLIGLRFEFRRIDRVTRHTSCSSGRGLLGVPPPPPFPSRCPHSCHAAAATSPSSSPSLPSFPTPCRSRRCVTAVVALHVTPAVALHVTTAAAFRITVVVVAVVAAAHRVVVEALARCKGW